MANNKSQIVPHLWFDKEAIEAANFYVSIFPGSEITGKTAISGQGKRMNILQLGFHVRGSYF
jgi:predicted 3-demethylubiquinone-9 3-methyltransferase (glyoxalase superfamily)